MSVPGPSALRPGKRGGTVVAAASYAALLVVFWNTARYQNLNQTVAHFGWAFTSFALLWAPYWFFGFGFAPPLRAALHARWMRVLLPGTLVVPYLVFALPRGEFRVFYAAAFACLPIAVAAVFEFARLDDALTWQDIAVLAVAGVPVQFGMLRGAWPERGLGFMPKLLLMDALLYAFLVIRKLPDVGYDLRPRRRDLAVGLREWALFAPIGTAVGLGVHFITFHPHLPSAGAVGGTWFVTFSFIAIPEEFFFRGVLQNLVERRFERRGGNGRWQALLVAGAIFGLFHFNKPLPFNWRYVLLATIAGVFYGRAWGDRRRLFSAGITHATVDTVWSVWFE
ncbi:MAG: type II CAAX prenyl endopeptidase Rce1 family protein [Terriglobales bacterium]